MERWKIETSTSKLYEEKPQLQIYFMKIPFLFDLRCKWKLAEVFFVVVAFMRCCSCFFVFVLFLIRLIFFSFFFFGGGGGGRMGESGCVMQGKTDRPGSLCSFKTFLSFMGSFPELNSTEQSFEVGWRHSFYILDCMYSILISLGA